MPHSLNVALLMLGATYSATFFCLLMLLLTIPCFEYSTGHSAVSRRPTPTVSLLSYSKQFTAAKLSKSVDFCATYPFATPCSHLLRVKESTDFIPEVSAGSTEKLSYASNKTQQTLSQVLNLKVVVTTATGYPYLDHSLTLTVEGNTTFQELKDRIEQNFPGNPPAKLLTLAFGTTPISCDKNRTVLNLAAECLGQPDVTQLRIFPLILLVPFSPIPSKSLMPSTQIDQHKLEALLVHLQLLMLSMVSLSRDVETYLDINATQATALNNLRNLSNHKLYQWEDAATRNITTFNDYFASNIERMIRCLTEEELHTLLHAVTHTEDNLKQKEDKRTTSHTALSALGQASELENQFSTFRPYTLQKRLLETLLLQFAIDWKHSIRVTLFMLFLLKFGTENRRVQRTLLYSIPALFLLQTRVAKLFTKFVWYALPRGIWLSGIVPILSVPQQELLTFNEEKFIKYLYGDQASRVLQKEG